MELLVINHTEVGRLLPMGRCIDLMGDCFRTLAEGQAVLPLRSINWLPDRTGALGLMPGFLGDPPILGVKVISVFPGNQHTEFESHQGAVLLFDAKNGQLLAIVDAGQITAIRTAAASGLATRLLAREQASELALIGTGTQAGTHLEAMMAVRPIERVRVWSRTEAHAERFVKTWSDRAPVDVASTIEGAVRGAHIVCTLTAATEPILQGEWLAPGTHVNAVGACTPKTRELDLDAVERSRLYVDCRESALNEAGELLIPLSRGELNEDHIVGEIGQLITGSISGRTSDRDVTLYKSLGIALQDLASAHEIYTTALAEGAGARIAVSGCR